MKGVIVTGTGAVRIGRHYEKSVRALAAEAAWKALDEAGVDGVDFVVVASSLSYLQEPQLSLASYITSSLGLGGARAIGVESGETSGLAALDVAYSLLQSEKASRVLVVGVDKLTNHPSGPTYSMLQLLHDAEAEAYYKIGHAGVAALLFRLYLDRYNVERATTAYWPALMHAHAKENPHAMLRFAITPEKVVSGMPLADPITLLDAYPLGDGAAAVVLEREDEHPKNPLARVVAVESAIGMPGPQLRDDPLDLESVRTVIQRIGGTDGVDVMEIHDSFTIYALLELEAMGLAEKGKSAELVAEGYFSKDGEGPLANPSGGLKARGHPIGATDVYKIVELANILAGTWSGVRRGGEKRALALSINAAGSEARAALLEAL
ncbi:MAG: thiolase family protein [Desulfurococcales archaeon]|nr:thiolase family protein [Desulfurococcales archaeon]